MLYQRSEVICRLPIVRLTYKSFKSLGWKFPKVHGTRAIFIELVLGGIITHYFSIKL